MGKIKSGSAEIDMIVWSGMDLTGFAARYSPSTGTHDSPKIRCIILDDGKTKFALIECDLLGFNVDFVQDTKTLIEKAIFIPSQNIVLACTHTHSGPACMILNECGDVNLEWLEQLKPQIVECAKKAIEDLKPAKLSYGVSQCGLGINRVIPQKADTLRDTQVGVLTIKDAKNDKTDTVLVNYACHPVVMGGDNLLYSKDYPNYTEIAMKKSLGQDVKFIFANGCCGDINPYLRNSFDHAEIHGVQLAASALRIDRSSELEVCFDEADINVVSQIVSIPLSYDLDLEKVQNLKAEYEVKLAVELAKGMNNNVYVKIWGAHKKWAESIIAKIENQTLAKTVEAEIMVARIEKLTIVTLPFEVFHEIGLKIKEYFGINNTIVIGYANGDNGYMPSKALYKNASYEASTAFVYYNSPGPVCPEAEEIVYKAIFK